MPYTQGERNNIHVIRGLSVCDITSALLCYVDYTLHALSPRLCYHGVIARVLSPGLSYTLYIGHILFSFKFLFLGNIQDLGV